ncbi:MAG: hypothetical protein KBS95_04395 [Alistipes sp.]|nr:hypothetical protein [Candidatus Alistipes equi]
MTKQNKVTIVVTLYREELPLMEMRALQNNLKVLEKYPFTIVYPQNIDISKITEQLERKVELWPVSEKWLGRQNGIAGYNRMMLSSEFYSHFQDSEYILICHTDSWVFKDELYEWCEKGYDCVAAPWLKRKIYDIFPISLYLKIKNGLSKKRTRAFLYDKIGNGGLSLRKVDSFLEILSKESSMVENYLSHHGEHLYNEDVFWASWQDRLKYPKALEALHFSIDMHPKYCYRLLGELPFGCHKFPSPRVWKFWKNHITIQ